MKITPTMTVMQNQEKTVPTEILAEAIVAISSGVKRLLDGPLNERCLVLLIQHAAPNVGLKPISQKEVKAVLEGIQSLEKKFLKSKK